MMASSSFYQFFLLLSNYLSNFSFCSVCVYSKEINSSYCFFISVYILYVLYVYIIECLRSSYFPPLSLFRSLSFFIFFIISNLHVHQLLSKSKNILFQMNRVAFIKYKHTFSSFPLVKLLFFPLNLVHYFQHSFSTSFLQFKYIEIMTSLKQQCRERLKIAFDSVRSVSTQLTFILVVDEYALKVLSNTVKMMELINFGVNLVQKLQLDRKRFSQLQAVYLIHPDSYDNVIKDFQKQGPLQYHYVHILSLTKINVHIMNEISKSKVAPRIKTLKELNFNFSLYSQNEVLLACVEKDTFSSTLSPDGLDSEVIVRKTIDELTTVLTSMSQFYIVQILYNQSENSQKIAFGLKEKLEKLFEMYQKYGTQNYSNSAPQTTFLILDRPYDAVSPLVKDFHYLPLLYDMKNVKEHKVQLQSSENKKLVILNEGDQIFDKYRYTHIAKTLEGISDDFKAFSKGHVGAKLQKQEGQMKVQEMKQIMKKIPQYTQSKDQYNFHMDMVRLIMKKFEKEKYRVQGQLQQTIITQTNQKGKHLKHPDILKEVLEKVDEIPLQEDKARVLLIALMCLELKAKQKSFIIEKFASFNRYDDLYKNVQLLCGHRSYNLPPPKRSSKEQDLVLDRHQTKIQEAVRSIATGGQADLKYLRIGTEARNFKSQAKATGSLGRAKLGANRKEKTVKPRLIVFICSAMGYNEIRSLSQFEKDYHIIYCSHNFVTQNQYLKMVNNLVLDQL